MLPSADQRGAVEAGQAGARQGRNRLKDRNRVVIVRIDDEELVAPGELLGGGHGVGRSQRVLLHGEGHVERARGDLAPVVVADGAVLGADHQADVPESGVGQRADDVVKEGPADRDHPLDAGVGRTGLGVVQAGACRRAPHPRAEPPGQDHRLGQSPSRVIPTGA